MTKTNLIFKCDMCEVEFSRNLKSVNRMKKNRIYDKDYCKICCRKMLNNREEYKKNMSNVIKKLHLDHPEIGIKISNSMKTSGANVGDKNGMKKKEAREKVSIARKKMLLDPDLRKEYSERSKKAWKDGKFDGVRVGQCKWFEYNHSDGKKYKVQGTWELAFIKWLDKNKLKFDCHKKWIPYILDGNTKNWYPDFYVYDWNSYVDVKCLYFYKKDKFDAIEICNPDIKIKILFKEDLLKLGVEL